MAIFSRFPIVRRGTIPFGKLTQNHAMWADLARPKDTIRVFNVHFQSMSMAESDIATATESRFIWPGSLTSVRVVLEIS